MGLSRTEFLRCIILGLASSLPSVGLARERSLEFRAWVQVRYRFKQNLGGWENTARSLPGLIPGADRGPSPAILVDRSPEELERFLTTPSKHESASKVLYLGLHVNRKGEMLFSDGSKAAPGDFAARIAPAHQRWRPDAVIVDTCHAAAFAYDRRWTETFPCPHLFAADTHQLAWERKLDTRQPIHLAKLYPGVRDRLEALLGPEWDGSISDLGFRSAKLADAGGSLPDSAEAFIREIANVAPEDLRSAQFRHSTLLWLTPEQIREISRRG